MAGVARPRRVAGTERGAGADLDNDGFRPLESPGDGKPAARDDGPLPFGPVAPGTLFTASLLAPPGALAVGSASLMHASREDWAPPSSSLSLRDRRV